MDLIGSRAFSSSIRRWCGWILLVLLVSFGAFPSVSGADTTSGSSPHFEGHAWVEADPGVAYRYLSVGWIDWAEAHFGEIARREGDVEAWIMAGLARQTLGDDAGALDAYRQGIGLATDDVRSASAALALLGNLHLSRGELAEAKAAFEKAVQLSPDSAQAAYGLGRIHEQAGSRDRALDFYRRAAESASDWIEPIVAQAALLNGDRRFVEALALLRGADALGTWHAEYQYQLGLSFEGLLQVVLERGMTDETSEALTALGIDRERATAVLKEQALHAVDRVKQLRSDHTGADPLLSRLNRI